MKQIITAPSGATIEVIQLVEGDGMFNPRVWDAVAEFLGLDPNSGRGEHFTMRRPPHYRPGSVEVTLHQDWGSGLQGTAQFGDWLVKFPDGKVLMLDAAAFAIVFGDYYARERCQTCGSLDPAKRGRDTSTQRLDLCQDSWHEPAAVCGHPIGDRTCTLPADHEGDVHAYASAGVTASVGPYQTVSQS